MAVFRYRAKRGTGEIVEGRIEANSKKEAIEKVSVIGYFPLQIEEEIVAARIETPHPRFFFRRIKSREITVFTAQLATLLKSGIPILDGLHIILEQSVNPAFKNLLKFIYDEVKNGSCLSSVLERFPALFSPIYIALVRAGEASGSLPMVLSKIIDYRRKQEHLLSSVRVALAYPLIMAVVGTGTVVFMLTFVIPKLMDIFLSMEAGALPMPTRILIATSDYLKRRWFYILSIILLFVFFFRQYLKTKAGKTVFSMLTLKLPLLAGLILKLQLSRFCRTLEILLKAGIPILQAIELSAPCVGNEIIKKHLLRSLEGLKRGGSFGRGLKDGRLFPVFASNLIIVGEESGKLDDALQEVASCYEADIDETLKIATSLLEPILILGMGLIVGFIVISMLLPLFQLNVMAR